MVSPALFSSNHCEWATPRALAASFVEEFGITLDVCADAENAVCPRYFMREDDGLAQEWTGACWMNPPFGRDVAKWVKKAADSAKAGALVCCLFPVRSDTKWWHEHIWDEARHRPRRRVEIRFLKGRLKFGGAKENAPFPVAAVIFHPHVP